MTDETFLVEDIVDDGWKTIVCYQYSLVNVNEMRERKRG